MFSKHALIALAAISLTAGCTASGAITPSVASPGATSTTPGGTTTGSGTTTTGTGTSTSTTVTTNGALNPELASLYTVGRTWTYSINSSGGPGGYELAAASSYTYTEVVTAVNGTKATVKHTQTLPGSAGPVDSTFEVDLTAKSALTAKVDPNVTYTQTSSDTQSVTVGAGTFSATHVTGTVMTKASGASTSSAYEAWASAAQGLIKSITTTKVNFTPPAGLPPEAAAALAAAAGSDIKSTLELTAFH